MGIVVWQAKLNDEETERATDHICDRMIDELELAWERIKDENLLKKGE